MKEGPKIFVVIVTYKGMRWYDKCFSSLRESTIPLQTVVVDNTPGEEDAEYIKTHFPEVHLIKTNENLGFGRANNLGMRYALDNDGDYVFLLNQDAWIEKDTIQRLVEIAENHPEYALLSPFHYAPNSKILGMLLDDGNNNYALLRDALAGNLKELYPIKYVNAAAWLLPRKTMERVGGFCPIIYHFGEDDDYINRLTYHGLKVGLCPQTHIFHDSGAPLDGRENLRMQANRQGLVEYLNITKISDIKSYRNYLRRKMMISLLKGDRTATNLYKEKYDFVSKHMDKIAYCREQHKIIQSNWLNVNFEYNRQCL